MIRVNNTKKQLMKKPGGNLWLFSNSLSNIKKEAAHWGCKEIYFTKDKYYAIRRTVVHYGYKPYQEEEY